MEKEEENVEFTGSVFKYEATLQPYMLMLVMKLHQMPQKAKNPKHKWSLKREYIVPYYY